MKEMRCDCEWCSYCLVGEDILFEFENHLVDKHYEKLIHYWISNDEEWTREKAVKNFGISLLSFNPMEVECPFCDYDPTPSPGPWLDTELHMARHHWEEFVRWTEGRWNNPIWEIAVEYALEEMCSP